VARDRLLSAYRAGGSLVLLLDYDGTLVPIVEHPRLARLAAATRGLLQRLADRPRITVGVVSGRRLDDVRDMVGIPSLYYAGSAGLELDLRGERLIAPGSEAGFELMARLTRHLGEVTAAYSGAWVEDKEFGLTLHYRAVGRYRIDDLLARTSCILGPWTDRIRIFQGPMAVEVFLALGWTKGTAVERIVARAGPGALAFYAGDEANDADALAAATALGGVSLGIGPRAPAADYHLPDPAALEHFLGSLLDSLETGAHKI
jgi:trehalose-phosphatase